MKTIISLLLLLGIVSFMGRPVLAGRGDPGAPVNLRITVTPLQGDPGTVVTVSGTGADPSLKVFVTLSPQADSAIGALATVEVDPAANGSFNATLTVPAATPDGHYAMRAEQFTARGTVLQYYWNGFMVGAGGAGPLLPGTGTLTSPSLTTTAVLAVLLVIGMLMRGLQAVASIGSLAVVFARQK